MEENKVTLEEMNVAQNNDSELNEAEYNKAIDKVESYGLEWTFRSINYILNKENVSFGQLRSCVYIGDSGAYFDYIRSTLSLIKAGLIGSKQIAENEASKLEDRAYEILEDWRANFGFIGTLHLLIINRMELKHFFMGTPDLMVVSHLGSKNLQRDLGKNMLTEDLEQKVRQAQAMQMIV